MRTRVVLILGAAYLLAMAVVALWPTPVDRPAIGPVGALVSWCRAHGLAFVSQPFLEQFANVVLFIPLGVLLALLLPAGLRLLAGLASLSLSVVFELGQAAFLPERFASAVDVFWNGLGGIIGVLAVIAVHAVVQRARSTPLPRSHSDDPRSGVDRSLIYSSTGAFDREGSIP